MDLFDESTYYGRFEKYLKLTNVKHLFHSDSAIERCQRSMSSKEGPTKKCMEIVAACVHPTTQEIIPVYGRMSSFFPINIPICSGMLLSPPTLVNLIGWQWFNQTYNAIFNYSNSAKSKEMFGSASNEKIHPVAKGYAGSVVVSVGLAVGLSRWVKNGSMPPSLKPVLQKVVPFVATASAGMANVVLMRSGELKTGIPVTTMDGTYIGHSKIAAKKALYETAISRAVLPIPMLLLPPPFIAVASRFSLFSSSFLRRKIMELTFLSLAIAIGLPSAIALFPQHTHISIYELEDKLKQMKLLTNVGQQVKYNKGV